MKRISYISRFSRPLSYDEIEGIENKSFENNKRDGLSGVLVCFSNTFYQIIEGENEKLDECFKRILSDSRHNRIFCLEIEENITDRRYGDWNMKIIRLEESDDAMFIPIRSMLNSLVNTHSILQIYTPFEILEGIQKGQDPTKWAPLDIEKVVMFSDIVSSTFLHEKLTPHEMNEILTQYYETTTAIIYNYGGTVSKLSGDGLMAYFSTQHIDCAIESALLIQKSLEKIRKENEDKILSFLYAGIGISSGKVRLGNIGSSRIKDFTILGDTVNRAAKLESITRTSGYNIIFDETVHQKIIKETINVKHLGEYTLKGKTVEIKIFSVDEKITYFSGINDELLKRVEFYINKK